MVTAVTMSFGSYIAEYINVDIASSIGASIFITLGAVEIFQCISSLYYKDKKAEDKISNSSHDIESSSTVSAEPSSPNRLLSPEIENRLVVSFVRPREVFIVGFGLCATNVAGGKRQADSSILKNRPHSYLLCY